MALTPRFLLLGLCFCSLLCSLCTSVLAEEEESEKEKTALFNTFKLKTFREEFVVLMPGVGEFPTTFKMGSTDGTPAEQPVHEVKLTEPFQIAKYEVPQNLWEAVMGENPSRWKGPRNSVEMLSYSDAVEFCQKATEQMRATKIIEQDEVIRLPTEAEWEYAARAGTATAYSFGDDPADLKDFGWYSGNAKGNDPPVGAKKPNDWNLYDMHGYLWEWCSDPWHENYEGAPADGSEWSADGVKDKRVLRSGSWKDDADQLTSTFRIGAPAELKDDAVGLRCVLSKEKK